MSTSPFEELLATLIRQRGVLGCMVVGESDGLVVDANVQVGIQTNAVAALAAALYRRARLAAEAAGLGTASFLHLAAEKGHVCAIGREGLVIVTIAEPRAQIGLIRSAMMQQIEALA